jgi:hypothetical protein
VGGAAAVDGAALGAVASGAGAALVLGAGVEDAGGGGDLAVELAEVDCARAGPATAKAAARAA